MNLYLTRAGSSGEYESKFLADGRVYLTWGELKGDMRTCASLDDIVARLQEIYPEDNPKKLRNWASQILPFLTEMTTGDWVVLPSKMKSAIHFGKITGDCVYDPAADGPYRHYRPVDWFAQDIPRTAFDPDLLYSFGAFMTICRIKRNNAVERIQAMEKSGWRKSKTSVALHENWEEEHSDIERLARDRIAEHVVRRFQGHGMARVVEEILKAKGYKTYRSPEGADKGIDLLAAPGPFGYGSPRICVQVKSGDSPVDRPTLQQLIGSMHDVGADQGLLVSLGGFKGTVDKEVPGQFFRVRLWDLDALIDELLDAYDDLDADFRAELPLKRVWALVEEA